MKNHITILLLAAILPVAALAQTPSESLKRIQAEVATGEVTAFYEKGVTIDGTYYGQPWQSVSWNSSSETITVGNTTMTYGEVMQFVIAIANQEWAKKKAAAAAPVAANSLPTRFNFPIYYRPLPDGVNYAIVDASGKEIGQTLVAKVDASPLVLTR